AGTRVGEAVLAAADRGVKVRVIKDIGAIMCEVIEMNRKSFFPRRIPLLKRIIYKIIGRTFPDTFVEDEHDQELGTRLLAHPNVTVEWINKTHTKYYLFDEQLIVTGSINIEDRHQNYFDYMLALEDPDLVRRLRTRMAGEAPYDPERNIDFLCNTHRKEGESVFEIKPEVLRFIEVARESIYIEVAYIGDPEFADALVAAAKRGVRITILFSREANIGNDVNYWAIHDLYTRAPIEVYLTGTMIHAKLLLFDDELILTGSCNMNIFSLQKAAELDLVIRNEPALIEAIRALIAKRIEASSRVTSAEELAGFNPILASLQQLHQKLNPN
ncbi:MAG: phosphatidylserine/phosphatidylglycerophosphate/cardiolipin synthase family protein, partial [Roseibacillus sp.]|nr:phosphatidylserine/phosphatidylglycerophosphate/cardiolipin synthase family protein [Roseibacillus sp.]